MTADFNLPPGTTLADVCGTEPTRMTMRGDEPEPWDPPVNSGAFDSVIPSVRAWNAQCVAEAKAKGTL